MRSLESDQPTPEARALIFTEQLLSKWDNANPSEDEHLHFNLHVSHWLLENYGRSRQDGWVLHPEAECKATEMPSAMQTLLMYTYKDEVCYSDQSTLMVESNHAWIESDPVIPRYDEIAKLPTFKQQLEFARSQEDIVAGIVPTKVKAWPQLRIFFEPECSANWGLEFKLNQMGAEIFPYGRRRETERATNFALGIREQTNILVKTITELILVAAKHAPKYRRETDPDPPLLLDRLDGKELIPLKVSNYSPKPANAVKNLLVESLLKP